MPQAPQTEEPEKPFEHFRVSKKSIKFVGQDGVPDRVRIKSPRFRRALKHCGVEMADLIQKPLEEVEGNAALPEIAVRRRMTYEEQRNALIKMVLVRRGELTGEIAPDAAAAAAAASSVEKELDAKAATILQQQKEHMDKIAVSAQRRQDEERKRDLAAKELSARKAEEQRQINLELEQRKQAFLETVQQRRSLAEHKRLEREAKAAGEAAAAIEFARVVEADRIHKEEAFAEKQREREAVVRERSLEFAKEHSRKIERIQKKNKQHKARMEIVAVETQRKLEESDRVRRERVDQMQRKIMQDNKARNLENERRRVAKVEEDQRRLIAQAQAVEKRLEEVDQRLVQKKEQETRDFEEKRQTEKRKDEERQKILAERDRQRMTAEGEALHVRDAKERAIRRAAARRERSLLVNTESARLSFDTKRAAVKRLKRRQSFERLQIAEQVFKKNERVEKVNLMKESLKATQRQMARQFLIDRRRQKELAEREALRSKSAEPCIGGGAAPARTDKKGQLEAMRRLSAVHSHYPEAEEDLLTSYM